ncbi:MAG: ParA family protein [Halobacteriota archaeon]
MSEVTSAALVGSTGGAGTTRTTVELAATLARDGRAVAILDAAFGTQGLSDYVTGRLTPDVTTLVTSEEPPDLGEVLSVLDLPVQGRVACAPASAPFERLARAKSPEAARRFEGLVARAETRFDHVLVDTPPVAANQAIAAVNGAQRTALVAPGTTRGADAVERMRARLRDVGVDVDVVVSTRGELAGANVGIPESQVTAVGNAPAAVSTNDPMGPPLARAAELLFDVTLDLEFEGLGLRGVVERYVDGRE